MSVKQNNGQPLVGVVMGSDSDLPVVKLALDVLDEFGVSYEARILSAHRIPDVLAEWARGAEARGLRVIIAAAGGAAHLPGLVAAHTALPVIGVPIKGRTLDGMDALLAIVQMPPGVPVAAVAIDGARNAALLAVQVLAAADPELRRRFAEFKAEQARAVAEKDARLRELGAHRYLGATPDRAGGAMANAMLDKPGGTKVGPR